MNNKLIYSAVFFSIMQFLFLFPAKCQNGGYSKIINIDNSISLDIDDIKYFNYELYLRGNSFNANLNKWGQFIAKFDTTGSLLWHNVIYDSTQQSDLISNTPSRLGIGKNKELFLPCKYLDYNKLGAVIVDSLGNELFQRFYNIDILWLLYFDVRYVDNNYYLFGLAEQSNYSFDVFILKCDRKGNFKWIKYFGQSNLDEVFGDVWVNPDNTFTINASASKDGWYTQNEITGLNKPWVFTIDTSGDVLNQWFGSFNDVRTNGRGPLCRAGNGDFVIASYDIKEFPGSIIPVRASPSVTRLDSNFNLVWKQNLTGFNNFEDKIQDMVYDSARDDFIVAGDQRIYHTSDSLSADAWFEKISGQGEIVWNQSDTALYIGYGKQAHYTAGIAIAPSGSLYVAGWVYSNENNGQGWIIKVTPDGCSDTLCTITSLENQIVEKQKRIFIHPNPVIDELHLFIPDEINTSRVEILNVQGESIERENLHHGENILSLKCPPGIYVYVIRENDLIISSGRFVKL